MTDRDDRGPTDPMPEDVTDLHRELDSLRIRERASFGPELKAELEDAWTRRRTEGRLRRFSGSALAAASLGGLLLLGLAAPQARGALADVLAGMRAGLTELRALSVEDAAGPVPRPAAEGPLAEPVAAASRSPDETDTETVEPGSVEAKAAPEAAVVFPDLLDRYRARRLVERFYPEALAGTGIGGRVGLRMFVDASGRVDEVRLTRSSGIGALDSAAVRAAPGLRFRPARTGAVAVGTWIELGIDFSPRAPDREAPASRGSSSDAGGTPF